MAISAGRVTRMGMGGGIWQPQGSYANKVEGVAITTTWFDEQQSQVTGTRNILQPGYHKNGRNY